VPSSKAPPEVPPAPLPRASREVLDRYLGHLEHVRRRSEHTIRNYRHDLEGFLRFLAERETPYDEAGRTDGRSYLSALRNASVGDGSVKRIATTIRGFYGWLDNEGVELKNEPGDSMLRLRFPIPRKRLPKFLTTTPRPRRSSPVRTTAPRAASATVPSSSCCTARASA